MFITLSLLLPVCLLMILDNEFMIYIYNVKLTSVHILIDDIGQYIYFVTLSTFQLIMNYVITA